MPPVQLDQIIQIVANSPLARFNWQDRGVAPLAYLKGMAVVYARIYGKLLDGNPTAVEMAKANTNLPDKDALAWYNDRFTAHGLSNLSSGANTLRHLFILLIGLGMRESSGKHCVGRDQSASNTTADTAEAGLFQTSFNARSASPILLTLFKQYSANPSGFIEIFSNHIICKQSDLENFGSGAGKEFQRLSKECPAFAVEFAAVGLRNIRRHWGPINRKEVEIRPECDLMLQQVQAIVDSSTLRL